MWYVIQIVSGNESKVCEQIGALFPEDIYDECSYPKKHIPFRRQGKFFDVEKRLLPGYVFVRTDHIDEVYEYLKHVTELTRLIGMEQDYCLPLSDRDIEWMQKIGVMDEDQSFKTIGYTTVRKTDDTVEVVDGPLLYISGTNYRIVLHQRIAYVDIEFMGQVITLSFGVKFEGDE